MPAASENGTNLLAKLKDFGPQSEFPGNGVRLYTCCLFTHRHPHTHSHSLTHAYTHSLNGNLCVSLAPSCIFNDSCPVYGQNEYKTANGQRPTNESESFSALELGQNSGELYTLLIYIRFRPFNLVNRLSVVRNLMHFNNTWPKHSQKISSRNYF